MLTKEELTTQLKAYRDEVIKSVKDAEGVTDEKLNKFKTELTKHVDDYIERNVNKLIPGLGMSKKDAEKFSFGNLMKAIYTNNWKDASYEERVIKETIEKSANAGSLAAGAVFIPVEVINEVIELAKPDMPFFDLGVSEYNDLKGELPIPKITGRHTLYWVGEEEAPTESNMTFGEITLRPKTAALFTKISLKLLKQAGPVIDRIVRQELANSFAIGMHDAFLNAAGGEKKILGLFSRTGYTTSSLGASLEGWGTDGGRFTAYHAGLMIKDIENAKMLKKSANSYGFLMHPSVKWGMKLERIAQFTGQTQGEYAFNPIMSDEMLEKLLGYKVRSTTDVPANITTGAVSTTSKVVFGDWSQVKVGFWGGMEMRFSDVAGNSSGSALLNRQVWITGHQDVDMNIGDATGLTIASGAQTVFT